MASKGGKGSRKRAKDRRRAAKAARKAAYAALAGTGTRKRSRSHGSSIPGHPHKGPCGNGACTKCHTGPHNDPWQADPGSCLYGKRWTSSKYRD